MSRYIQNCQNARRTLYRVIALLGVYSILQSCSEADNDPESKKNPSNIDSKDGKKKLKEKIKNLEKDISNLKNEKSTLENEKTTLEAARDKAENERDDAEKQIDAAKQERDAAKQERDDAKDEKNAETQLKDAALQRIADIEDFIKLNKTGKYIWLNTAQARLAFPNIDNLLKKN